MDDCHKSPLCRFKACCNPEHLFWDTHANNCKRRELEKRARQAAKVLIDQMAKDTTSDGPTDLTSAAAASQPSRVIDLPHGSGWIYAPQADPKSSPLLPR
jgi:hypothetical protein